MQSTINQASLTAQASDYIIDLSLSDHSPLTVSRYASCIRSFVAFLGASVPSEYTAKSYFASLRARGISSHSLSIYYHAISPFLAAQGIPFKLKFKRHRRLPSYTSASQVATLIQAITTRLDNWRHLSPRDLAIIYTLAYTGIRRAELLSLSTRHIDLSAGFLRVIGKGDDERLLPICAHLHAVLSPYINSLPNGTKVFPLSARRLCTLISRYAQAAGVPHLHPHSFRHFFATQLIEAGVPLHEIQHLLGHRDIATTAIYLDVVPSHLQVAVSKLPNFNLSKSML